MPSGKLVGIQLVDKLIQAACVDAGPKAERMRLHLKLPQSRGLVDGAKTETQGVVDNGFHAAVAALNFS